MSQPMTLPSQLRIVNNKLTELGKIMYYQPDLFCSSVRLQQGMIGCCKAYLSYMKWHTLTVSQYLTESNWGMRRARASCCLTKQAYHAAYGLPDLERRADTLYWMRRLH